VCKEQLHYAREGVGQDGNGWQIFADEGEIKMYKREEEVNGLVMDPLKAYHTVQGVTAREMSQLSGLWLMSWVGQSVVSDRVANTYQS